MHLPEFTAVGTLSFARRRRDGGGQRQQQRFTEQALYPEVCRRSACSKDTDQKHRVRRRKGLRVGGAPA